MRPRIRRTGVGAAGRWAGALSVVALLGVAGCSDEGTIAEQARAGDQKGYIAGDGTLQQVAVGDREVRIDLSGTTLQGQDWSSADHLGEVVVINVWGSWCGPCKAEAPDLQAAYEHFQEAGDPVQFIGVNDRDGLDAAKSFEKVQGIGYPSLADDGGQTLVALKGWANPRPTTMVLDRDGLVAARVAGQVDETTLVGMVEDVLAE
ncbi:TlpA family protein disulfide reductase [Ornithinicoccus hortensis]|uniref:Thiol-disulfide isomerase/thioredoxin n=1 Tax=Ornithinicoccus hortensis TaxID=82346 RepID=A0A542YVS9_9MICO|nr:TlpA disulfide reductase family protein [Ornithinicoccus hortensis]TQL52189.1 thiol-disulfide isomerase/thioredoxin [Ornithinicoccus hortensis]